MPHTIDCFNAADQINYLKSILDTTTIRNQLNISINEKDDTGADTGNPNNYGVCTQSPYFLMANFLPQIVINGQLQDPVDQQYDTAEVATQMYIYYAFEFTPYTETYIDMANALQYLAIKLLEHRADQEPNWFSMSLPRLEIDNEVNRFYQENGVPFATGRIQLVLRHKGYYRN
jgi:hypothetical protein